MKGIAVIRQVYTPEEANIAITITDSIVHLMVGQIYFKANEINDQAKIIVYVAQYYPEYCQTNFQWNINRIKNGKRVM